MISSPFTSESIRQMNRFRVSRLRNIVRKHQEKNFRPFIQGICQKSETKDQHEKFVFNFPAPCSRAVDLEIHSLDKDVFFCNLSVLCQFSVLFESLSAPLVIPSPILETTWKSKLIYSFLCLCYQIPGSFSYDDSIGNGLYNVCEEVFLVSQKLDEKWESFYETVQFASLLDSKPWLDLLHEEFLAAEFWYSPFLDPSDNLQRLEKSWKVMHLFPQKRGIEECYRTLEAAKLFFDGEESSQSYSTFQTLWYQMMDHSSSLLKFRDTEKWQGSTLHCTLVELLDAKETNRSLKLLTDVTFDQFESCTLEFSPTHFWGQVCAFFRHKEENIPENPNVNKKVVLSVRQKFLKQIHTLANHFTNWIAAKI